jgi:thioredoxin-related protein
MRNLKMHKILIMLIIYYASLFSLGWRTYDEAKLEQLRTKKIIMLDFIRTGCHYCLEMDNSVFKDEKMAQWIEQRFIPVKINLDTENAPNNMIIEITPTFYFVDKDTKILKKVVGSWSIEDFKFIIGKIK